MGSETPIWTCGVGCPCIKEVGFNTPIDVKIKLLTMENTPMLPLSAYSITFSCLSKKMTVRYCGSWLVYV